MFLFKQEDMDSSPPKLSRKRKNTDNVNKVKTKIIKKIKTSPTIKLTVTKKSLSKKQPKKEIVDNAQDEVDGNVQMKNNSENVDWNEPDLLATKENISKSVAENFIKLLNDGCTLPFIARYRKGLVDNMMPDR